MEQNSDAWLKWRNEGLGSSDAPIIMGVSPWKTPFELWSEKLGLAKPFQGNWATQRGHDLEPKARAAFELEFGFDCHPTLAQHEQYSFLRASLDGYSKDEDAILEIKCPGKKDHQLALDGEVPEKYKPQIQHQLMVTGASRCFYYSYDGESGTRIEVLPKADYIQDLLTKEIDFWGNIQSKTPPELTEKDQVEIFDEDLLKVAEFYKKTSDEIKFLEKKLEEYKKLLNEKATHPKVKIGSLNITKAVRAGSVDYKAIPELNGIDLEPYRKKPTFYTMIRVDKE